jgi:transcriptional regulator with XRE-family HTH domain
MKSKLLKISKVDTRWMDENDYDLANPQEAEANAVIALKLRRYMRSHGMTQKELARRLSVTPQFVSKLLRGRQNLGIGTALKYGRLLNIKLIEVPAVEDEQMTLTQYGQLTVDIIHETSGRDYSGLFPMGRPSTILRLKSENRYVS